LYFDAFFDLGTTRAAGFETILPISWLAVRQYAILCHYDEYQTDFLHEAVQALDTVYLEWVRAQRGEPDKASNNPP